MADSMLKESPSGKPGKGTLDEKAIASPRNSGAADHPRKAGRSCLSRVKRRVS